MTTDTPWYIAQCLECQPIADQPFTNRKERDEWAEAHRNATHHQVAQFATLRNPTEPEGAWQCSDGHMFRYAPPPISPPWCAKEGCQATGFVWIIKDEVTARDWLPEKEGN